MDYGDDSLTDADLAGLDAAFDAVEHDARALVAGVSESGTLAARPWNLEHGGVPGSPGDGQSRLPARDGARQRGRAG